MPADITVKASADRILSEMPRSGFTWTTGGEEPCLPCRAHPGRPAGGTRMCATRTGRSGESLELLARLERVDLGEGFKADGRQLGIRRLRPGRLGLDRR